MLARESGTVQPKILDFGISKLLSADARTRLTLTGVSIGTPLYMSPEQVRGDDAVDGRTDVYALGVILYQSLTGTMPFDGNNYADLVVKIVMGNAPGIRAWNADLPAELEAIVSRAMAAARDERHASVSELAADLARFRGARRSNVAARMSIPRPSAVAASGATPRASAAAPRLSTPRPAAATPRMSAPRSSAGPTPFASETVSREKVPGARGPVYASVAFGLAALAAVLLWLFWPAPPPAAPTGAASASHAPRPPTPAPVAEPAAAGTEARARVTAPAEPPAATSAPTPPAEPPAASSAPTPQTPPLAPAAAPGQDPQQRAATPARTAHTQSTSAPVARPSRRARNRAEAAAPAEGTAGAEPQAPTVPHPVSEILDPFQ
jgi:serine/threonine-protein kinase